MRIVRRCRMLIGTSIFFASFGLSAATIDFESVPGVGTPTEGLAINTQYLSSAGVSFALEGGGSPRIAKVGSPRTAFQGFGGGDDSPAPGQAVGDYFLTDNGIFSNSLISPALLVEYATPTAAASGVLLDIDFDETWTIQARDNAGSILENLTINAGDPGTGDGLATVWSFNTGQPKISSIRFKGTRTEVGGFGLGFDNFSPGSPIPEPQTLGMFLAGLGTILLAVRRRLGLSADQWCVCKHIGEMSNWRFEEVAPPASFACRFRASS